MCQVKLAPQPGERLVAAVLVLQIGEHVEDGADSFVSDGCLHCDVLLGAGGGAGPARSVWPAPWACGSGCGKLADDFAQIGGEEGQRLGPLLGRQGTQSVSAQG